MQQGGQQRGLEDSECTAIPCLQHAHSRRFRPWDYPFVFPSVISATDIYCSCTNEKIVLI